MKLWQKDKISSKEVENFTVGKDREMDLLLAPFDILGSVDHVQMLGSIDLLTKEETNILVKELQKIYQAHYSLLTTH